MKRYLYLLLFLFVFPCSMLFAQEKEKAVFTISSDKTYIEPWNERGQGVRFGGRGRGGVPVRTIVQENLNLAWYPIVKEGTYDISLELSLPKEQKAKLKIEVSSPEDAAFKKIEKEIGIQGTGEFVKTTICKIDAKNTAYYKVSVKPLEKSGETYAELRNLIFEAEKNTTAQVIVPQHLSSPSVHLWLSPDDGKEREFDWLYGEIQVPEGFDPMYTYYMSIGFVRGYFGIQVNSASERRVLFSIWDSSNEAVDRAKVKDEDRVKLIAKGDGVTTGSFGNEGTGGQSYRKYDWKTGQNIRFLMNARRLPNDFVVYSAWFMDEEKDGWKYMASWKAPKEKRVLDGFYSFIENFGPGNGQETRKAFYGNYWGKELNGEWVEMNRTRVTHTDGKPDGRRDYEGGKADDGSNRFYMQSGGYTAPKDQKSAVLEKTGNPPKIDIEKMIGQIDQALEKQE